MKYWYTSFGHFFSLLFPVIIHFRFSVWNTCNGYEVWLSLTQLWVFFANKSECIPLDAFFYLFTHTQLIFYEPKICGDTASTKHIELSAFIVPVYYKPSVFIICIFFIC